MNRITLPSFTRPEVTSGELRQLVSALELRLQSIEDDLTSLLTPTNAYVTPTVSGDEVTLDYASGNYFFIDLDDASGNLTVNVEGKPSTNNHGRIEILVRQSETSTRTLSWVAGTLLWKDGAEHVMNPALSGYSVFILRGWGSLPWLAEGNDYS